MELLTAEERQALGRILSCEEMACKKARVYANTLTEPALASAMKRLADGHAARFSSLLSAFKGGIA